MDKLKILFPNFDKNLIEVIATNSKIITAETGSIIMKPGQYIKSTILVLSGKLKVYREDNEGNEFFMYYLLPGQACAISMICAVKSKTSEIMAKVEEDAELLSIPIELMERLMKDYKNWYEFVIETYRSRFEEVLLVIDNIAFKNLDERLEFYLKRNMSTFKNNKIQISHQEIANDLSTSREVISRLLKKMEQRGFLTLHRNFIEII